MGTKKKKKEQATEPIKLEYPFVGSFEKVSYPTFKNAILKLYESGNINLENTKLEIVEASIVESYTNIQLPLRRSKGTAEYYFISSLPPIVLDPGYSITIPTGIRCFLDQNWIFKILPMSITDYDNTLGTVGYRLDNTVEIINPDDYTISVQNDDGTVTEQEGQILVRITNTHTDHQITINPGSTYVKGIFEMYGLAYNENTIVE